MLMRLLRVLGECALLLWLWRGASLPCKWGVCALLLCIWGARALLLRLQHCACCGGGI